MAPPALMEELVEESLLRIPPDDPASLVRAALVCKEWRRIVASTGFRRRFRERHRTPPTLGVLYHFRGGGYLCISRFVATSSWPPQADHGNCWAIDARHGRVLFFNLQVLLCLKVWDPVTGEVWELPKLPLLSHFEWYGAVLCAAHGTCDHIDCHGGAFLVVVVASSSGNMRVHLYSSDTGSWSEPAYGASSPVVTSLGMVPAALVGNALYFFVGASARKSILKYELTTRNMSTIQPPRDFNVKHLVLTTMEDGGLGIARLEDSRLYLSSMETSLQGDIGWTRPRVIQLQTPLPGNATIPLAFAHSVVFVGTNEGLFRIDLKSHQVKKILDEACGEAGIHSVLPYTSFYTPALRMPSTRDGPNEIASVHEKLEVARVRSSK